MINDAAMPMHVASEDPEARVAAMARTHNDSTWIFAVAMRNRPAAASFTLDAAPGAKAVQSLGEDRTLALEGSTFRDRLGLYDVRLNRI